MTLALTGATGFVGQVLLDQALADGHSVRALTRRGQLSRPGLHWISGDLNDQAALRQLVKGAEAVIHVAGVVNAPDPQAFERGNVLGTLNLIEAAVGAGVPRFIHVSSLSAREPDLSRYGESKARAERLVMASPLDWTMVRPPWIYGPGDKDTLDMFKAARWGLVPVPPAVGHSSLLHVADLARLLLALLPSSDAVTARIFEPDDGRTGGWSHGDIARAIGAAMGRNPRVWHLSAAALDRAARIDMALRRSKAKLTRDRARYMAHPDWVVSPDKRPPAALWQPLVATPAGLAATAQWYKAQGWL